MARGGQKTCILKEGDAKHNHSPSEISDSDTAFEMSMRCSDSMNTFSGCWWGVLKRRKSKTGPVAAPAASSPVVGVATSAVSRPVLAKERNATAASEDRLLLFFRNASSRRTMYRCRLPVSSWG